MKMHLYVVYALLVACFVGDASARFPRGGSTIVGSDGGAIINIGEGELTPYYFLDAMKVTYIAFASGASPGTAQLDSKGNPTTTFTGLVTRSFNNPGVTAGNWTFGWSATTKIQITINGGQNTNCIVSGSGGSVTSGCAGGNVTFTTTGTGAGSISFDTQGNFSLQYPGTYAYGAAETADYYLVKTSNLSAYSTYNGTTDARGYFTPEFITTLNDLNPVAIRPMGWYQVSSIGGQVNTDIAWADRTQMADTSWVSLKYPMKYWSGGAGTSGTVPRTASGTCNGSGTAELYTANATANNPTPSGTPAYGTIIQGAIAANNTTTSPLFCWGTTVFPIWDGRSAAVPVGGSISAGIATFIFEPKLGTNGAWLYFLGGLTSNPPVEAQAYLANTVNANLWTIIPYLATNNYAAQDATAALVLRLGLAFIPEYSNEVWNFQFTATTYARAVGTAFGWSDSGTQNILSWYGLRVAQIEQSIRPIWAGRNFRMPLMYQGAGANANNTSFRFEGANLVASSGQKYCEYTGGIWSGICTGGVSYNSFPSRPIDLSDSIGFAPYVGGANLMFGADICLGCDPLVSQATFYQCLVNAQEGGSTAGCASSDPSVLVDNDIRTGRNLIQTVTCSGSTWTTPLAHNIPSGANVAFTYTGGTSYGNLVDNAAYRLTSTGAATFTIQAFVNGEVSGANITCGAAATGTVSVGFIGVGTSSASNIQTMQVLNSNWYKSGQYFASLYSSRPPGKAALRVEQYEGNPEPVGPSQAQCTTLGVTSAGPTTNFTATYSAGDTSLTAVTNAANLILGQVISGPGVSGGQTILNIDPTAQTAQLSAVTTAAGTAAALVATDNCSTSIAKAIYNYKNNNLAREMQISYYNQFMGRESAFPTTYNQMPNSKAPAALVLNGGNRDANNAASNAYSLINGPSPASPRFKTFDGFAAFPPALNFLLKRDLDPASNDNDPMWLDKAA